jgi:hypothetical protein
VCILNTIQRADSSPENVKKKKPHHEKKKASPLGETMVLQETVVLKKKKKRWLTIGQTVVVLQLYPKLSTALGGRYP